jgi:cyclic pyranopterin phosphate synthase
LNVEVYLTLSGGDQLVASVTNGSVQDIKRNDRCRAESFWMGAMSELTHLDSQGLPRMVDISDKKETLRQADAEAVLWVGSEVMKAVRDGRTPKGNIYETARIAGIMGAKRTSELIPLCHPLSLTHVSVDMESLDDRIVIRTSARTLGSTGVEMEALTAASVAGLTLYDMLKALSKEMHLDGLRLLAKSGGRSGDYRAEASGG